MGSVFPGVSAKNQRKLAQAIKRARAMGELTFFSERKLFAQLLTLGILQVSCLAPASEIAQNKRNFVVAAIEEVLYRYHARDK